MRKQAREDGLKYGEGSIIQRGEVFQARWHELTSKGPKRRARSFPTRDAAEDHLREMHRAHRDGRYLPPSEQTVLDVVNGYIRRGASDWRPYTLAQYRARTLAHIAPTIGIGRAHALTTSMVQHWIDLLVSEGLQPETVRGIVNILSGAMKEATRLGNVDRNPVTGCRLPRIEHTEPALWSREQVQAVMRTIDDPMYYALYRIALATGMRPGELRALRWSDVDLEEMTITVRRTITRNEQQQTIVGKTTKTNRSRPISIAEPEIAVLRSWKITQTEQRLQSTTWDKGNYVFTRPDGRYLADGTWQYVHRQLCKKANVPFIVRHALRHINATDELAAGTSAKIVSERLGHASINTTLNRYSHVSPAVHRNAALELSQRLFGVDSTINIRQHDSIKDGKMS